VTELLGLPKTSYLVCGNQRSGTTLLCSALADTRVAGRPDEYFLAVNEAEQPAWRCWEKGPFGIDNGATDRESYLRIVYRLGSTPNGVFGAKLMWNNLQWALAKFLEMPAFSGLSRAEIFHAAFPNLRIVSATRCDRVRQAVSWALMAQGRPWVEWNGSPSPMPQSDLRYDADLIRALEGLIIEGEQGWRELYREIGVTPIEVVYEDLANPETYERSVRGVLEHLGLDAASANIQPPRTRRQADDVNEAWVSRYLSESGSRL